MQIVRFYTIFVLFCGIFTGNRWKTETLKNLNCACLGNAIPYKMTFVSTIKVKKCGRRYISCSQSVIFQEKGKTHQKTTILAMCKIYNVNNSQTADL